MRDGHVYHVLRSPFGRYIRLDDDDLALWNRMDGRTTVQALALAHFLERGDFAADRLRRLVRDLRHGGFLGEPPLDAYERTEHAMQHARPLRRVIDLAKRLMVCEVITSNRIDALAGAIYRGGGWLLYARATQILWIAIVLVGLGLWWRQFILADHALFKTNGSYLLGLITLFVLDAAGVNIHDVVQGLTLKHIGRRVNRGGIMSYYFVPIVFLDTTDAWMASRRQRILVSWSGPCATLILGCLLAIGAYVVDGSEMASFLFKGATIWLANAFFNLLPVLELDGYFIFVDYLEMPALRANAASFVSGQLWQRLSSGQRFSYEERVFTAFGLLSGLVLVLVPVLVFEARDLRYYDTLTDLWNSPQIGSELMAVGMAGMFLGPAAASVAGMLFRALRAVVMLVVHRVSRGRGEVPAAYVEALSGLPFLAEVSRVELAAIARHLEPMRKSAGTIIVRQGESGDRFYLLTDGYVRVGKVTAEGEAVGLARLGPGDYFGEAALVAHVPRTASVVAESDVSLLTLDAGHFHRWLGARVELANAIRRSVVERHHLAALPIFQGTGPAELDRLARDMLITRHSAGDTIVRQGDPGDRFYVIADGRVEVLRGADLTATEQLAELGRGEFFGEMALLSRQPRNATVRAMSAVETYSFSAESFRDLLGSEAASAVIHGAARARAGAIGNRTTLPGRRRGRVSSRPQTLSRSQQ
ncbi:MAG: cyclic nucleotide-binding domain-containing protein [Chloroflexota bacterium]